MRARQSKITILLFISLLAAPAMCFHPRAQEQRAPRRQFAVTFDDLPFTGDGGRRA